MAVLADPVFDANDERVRATRGERAPAAAMPGFDGPVRRLPFTRREAEDILASVAPGETMRALDFRASRATATSETLGGYRVVHFATHAFLDDTRPALSGLVLSLVDEQGVPQDGFLRLHELYGLRLPVELVVLSACQTALGKEAAGEGLVGLTRGLMYAGAARVVRQPMDGRRCGDGGVDATLLCGDVRDEAVGPGGRPACGASEHGKTTALALPVLLGRLRAAG